MFTHLHPLGVEKKSGGSTLGANEIEKLRASIQVLVKHTGPLGSCLDFIQEDIGLMSNELKKWEAESRRYVCTVYIYCVYMYTYVYVYVVRSDVDVITLTIIT